MTKDGGSAFPYSALNPEGPMVYKDSEGMSLRDYFAAAVLPALIGAQRDVLRLSSDADVADIAYKYADEMLKARDGGKHGS